LRIESREAPVATHDEWPCALRVVHLLGGLYAVNRPQDDEVQLYASADHGSVLCAFKIPVYGALFQGLEKFGLRPLGTIILNDARQQEGIYPPDARHYYRCPDYEGPWAAWDAAQKWSQIAHYAAKCDADIPLMDLARRISFELNACSAKWFDLFHAYEAVLNGLIRSGEFRAGQRFNDMNCFAVYLAIHSLLSEMTSLRDYLAEFVAQHVLASQLADTPYMKMSNLVGVLRKRSDLAHPAVRTVIAITAEKADGLLSFRPTGIWSFIMRPFI
jgi:hypothetical protein